MAAGLNSPPGKPFVEVPEYIEQSTHVQWSVTAEEDLLLVLEANRRFLIETKDPRQASALTLSWAMLRSGGCGGGS